MKRHRSLALFSSLFAVAIGISLAGSPIANAADKPKAEAAAEKTAASTAVAPAKDFDVEKAIAAGDHTGLAAYYKEQAEKYRQKAAKHDTMHADYKKSHVHYKGMENALSAHCTMLKERALETAKEYDELAKKEESLAAPKK